MTEKLRKADDLGEIRRRYCGTQVHSFTELTACSVSAESTIL